MKKRSKYRILKTINSHGVTRYFPQKRSWFVFWTSIYAGGDYDGACTYEAAKEALDDYITYKDGVQEVVYEV
jgi:hypothetical protein